MENSRTANSLKNSAVSVSVQIATILLSFIGRTVFIKQLNIEYLGVNGLFSNILTILSLAELGIGTAITYMMYKPIADGDTAKIAALNNLYRQVYNWIGAFILFVGLLLTPFITYLIKNPPKIVEDIHVIYILYVLNVSMSYFFTYKRSLLIAYQKEYVNNKNILQFSFLKEALLITVLFTIGNYYVYLLVQVLVTLLSNCAISYKTNKLFPEVVRTRPAKVPKNEIKLIVKNTMAMVCHKIGSVLVSGTGNVFISYYIGISVVGIYSNYVLISTSACAIIVKAVNSVTASFGNLVAMDEPSRIFAVFKKLYFINFVLAFAIAILFYSLVDPFISVWIGRDYYLDNISVLLIATNSIFFYQVRIPAQIVINTYGLFWQVKWKSIVEAVLNISISFVLTACLDWGINGILLSMLLSNIATNLWWEPYCGFKYGFKLPLRLYLKELGKSSLLLLCALTIMYYSVQYIEANISNIFISMFLIFIIAIMVIIILIIVAYRGTVEYVYAINMLKILYDKMCIGRWKPFQ